MVTTTSSVISAMLSDSFSTQRIQLNDGLPGDSPIQPNAHFDNSLSNNTDHFLLRPRTFKGGSLKFVQMIELNLLGQH